MSSGDPSRVFRPDVPSPARMYDYYLGGKDHYPADREAAEKVIATMPPGVIRTAARQNRSFLGRAVRYLTGEAGIRQFLDIGTGLPTMNSVHETTKAIAPECRIVYVDNDPIVIAHGREMLQGIDQTVIIQQDLREPEKILTDEQLHQTLDLDQPVAVLLVAILHFIRDEEDPRGIIDRLLAPLPSGSYLVISHATADRYIQMQDAVQVYRNATTTMHNRSRQEISTLLTGLELADPGLVWLPQWRPDADTGLHDNPQKSLCYAAVARKP
ncbi:SAM-dependent methyltransferase [Actinoallomurus oryzae]|uniref:SAM-dependent methyltransferase n=1 Tax=Actinoallomurus oryzae TaxID=502180 RepID=UPI0031E5C0E9